MYGAALYRLRKEDFSGLRITTACRPAWPISYDDMEPYYTKAEQMYQVHGARGEDPTEPPASAPYPFPPCRTSRASRSSPTISTRSGYHPFHTPCGIMLNEANMPYSTCIRCKDCDGFPCVVHAKSDAEVLGVRPALEYPNVTLLIHAKVVKLNTNATGTAVTEVVVEASKAKRKVPRRHRGRLRAARRNSAKLLLDVGQR